MEEIQETDKKSLDKQVESVENINNVNLPASDLSNEVSSSESSKVFINMENSGNNSEVVRKSPLCIESESIMPSGKTPKPPHDQCETQISEELVKPTSETSHSTEISSNVEGIPIGGGDLSESECAPGVEVNSEKGSANYSVSESVKQTSGKNETGDINLKETEFLKEALERDVHGVGSAKLQVTGASDHVPNQFQKESSEDAYCLEDSIHSFPKRIVSGSEAPDHSEGETAATRTVLDTDDASVSDIVQCERTVIRNDFDNISELEDDETSREIKEMSGEESVVSDTIVSTSATIAESNVEPTDESVISTLAETSKETEVGNADGNVRDSVIAFESNAQSETNNDPNEMECLDSEKENTEITYEVSKPGLEVVELDENLSVNDDESSIKDISVSQVESQASNLKTNENEVAEKDPLSETNKDDEEMLAEEIDLEVEKNSEKESHSEVNNEEEEMLLSGETEMDIQSCSEKESHSNLDKDEENLLEEESEIDFPKSSEKESGETAFQDDMKNAGEEKQTDFENERGEKDVRGESIEVEGEGDRKEELDEKEEEDFQEKGEQELLEVEGERKEEEDFQEKREQELLEKEEEEHQEKEREELQEKEVEELQEKEGEEQEKEGLEFQEKEGEELQEKEGEELQEKEGEDLQEKEREELQEKEGEELEEKEEEELEEKEEEELEEKEGEELEEKEGEELREKEGEELQEKEEEELEEKEEGGLEDKNEKSNEKVTEEASISNELEKDSAENSYDMQENVEFVQIDSDDKDENSQQSMDVTANENTNVSENDPIAVSNEEHKENDIIVEEDTDEPAVEADISEVEKDDDSIADKTVDSAEEPESVDISLMCETVLEEANSTIIQSTDESGVSRARTRTSLVAVDGDDVAEIIDVEVIDDSEKEKRRKGTSKNNRVENGRGKNKANSNLLNSANDASNVNDDEEICIIPDAVPRVVTGKEAKGKTDALKARRISKSSEEKVPEKTPEVQKDAPETSRRTPGRPQRQAAKRAECQIKEIAAIDEAIQETEERTGGFRVCDSCFKVRSWVTSFKFQENGTEKVKYFCSQDCATNFKKISRARTSDADANSIAGEAVRRFTRKCAQCSSVINGDEKNLSWETMDYCNEECLGRYQKVLGSQCANCKGTVASASLGKYCVRFGYDVKQFCCSGCLEEFKKGLKNCSYCQKDISSGTEGFLAPVGDKGQFKDFCTQLCMEKYDQMSNNHAPPVVVQVCAVCNNEKVVSMEVIHKNRINKFCSEPCFAAFRFVNGMMADQCYMCKKYFDKKEVENFSVYSDDLVHSFCSKTCMNVYILGNRKIVACHWCKVKKYNFDMIKRVYNSGQLLLVCSLNCLSLYQSGVNTASLKRVICDTCGTLSPQQYNLNMSDNSVRNFCTYPCVMKFQESFTNKVIVDSTPFPTGGPKRYIGPRRSLPMQQKEAQRENVPKTTSSAAMPVISSVQSLASDDTSAQNNMGITTRSSAALKQVNNNIPQNATQSSKIVRQVIIRPPMPKPMRNKAVTCRPTTHTKGTHCRPIVSSKDTQTESTPGNPILIPVPVPIYVPAPMCMYSTSFPVPVPFPLPVPVPIFIPTTRNSAKGIMKEIKRIQEKIPTDPFEAELLMMAEIVAGQKKEENYDSDSDVADNADATSETGADAEEGAKATTAAEGNYTPENVDNSNTFGDDMLQMALLKMATELEEPADLEAALTPTTITTQPAAVAEPTHSESEDDPEPVQPAPEPRSQRGKKRAARSQRTSAASSSASTATNKRRRVSVSGETPHLPPPEPAQPPSAVEQEKPDANMCLKYTLGVNAWKRWVLTKNAELEKAAANNRKLKLFKTEILQQTADELNYSLCLFVKEVRKPNGQEYAPDTIYYLCLGIQQYLFESGRIDNIFTDPYYEKFTECLDEVAKKFSSLYNDSQYIVTRVEEEHLWESKQLGAHSPHVLLSTLMFFNTKHFNLTTVEEHMQLSFSHIMKHWKRNPNQSGGGKSSASGSRNVLLRFYPPQSALDANSKKKKVYEQQENEENPLRCPVKLYEFYLSKCPESVKTRNDVFYLLPERSCVPDSPVWYSTMALGKEPLMKMLHRVKMVKEINQALLKS